MSRRLTPAQKRLQLARLYEHCAMRYMEQANEHQNRGETCRVASCHFAAEELLAKSRRLTALRVVK